MSSKKKLIPSVTGTSQQGGLPQAQGHRQAMARMQRALDVAATTPAGDVPVGAVIYDPDGAELATGVNRREALADPTAHAEVEAIRAAVREYGDSWRSEEHTSELQSRYEIVCRLMTDKKETITV